MTRPILVFGAGGRVGGELVSFASAELVTPTQAEADLTDLDAVRQWIDKTKPAAIINLAACTLPRAEREDARSEAVRTNVHGVCALAESTSAPIILISTDCVFDGNKAAPYLADDRPNPQNHYGATKRDGETNLAWKAKRHIIIRTTGVYLADKPNFLKLVLDKARAGEELTVVSDSIYTPTDARELAKAILLATERVIEDPSVSGTYHFAGPDVMSYMDFADLVLEEAGLSMPIHATTMAEREKVEGFKRPKNAALNSDKFAEVFGLRHRPTRECVRELVKPR